MPRRMFQVNVNIPASLLNNLNNNEVFNPYVFVRNRLYHFVFNRFALLYARLVRESHRKFIEFCILLVALFCFIILVYVHVVFVQTPMKCLDDYRGVWQQNGILRVEILSGKGKENYTLDDSYWKEKTIRLMQFEGPTGFFHTTEYPVKVGNKSEGSSTEETNETVDVEEFSAFDGDDFKDIMNVTGDDEDLQHILLQENFQTVSEDSILASDPQNAYIMEFSLEYGYLRLRASKRKELNISVIFVILDPEVDQCFGGSFNKFLLDNLLGYDNILLSSIKQMAKKRGQKGYVRNAVMDVEYIFLTNWSNDKSYLTAGFVMMIFTLTISTLLRHSHHQIFIVVGSWVRHLMTAFQRPTNIFDVIWPRSLIPSSGAPILTVVLALVGMEAVMSDFFADRSIALHIIIIVWFADLYDAVCCQSTLAKRHWFRFFYLYHFLFYAYNYKFGGVYWPLTLVTSWMFSFHSMVFFFHHYELPRFLRNARMNAAARANSLRAQQNTRPGNGPALNNVPQNSTHETPQSNPVEQPNANAGGAPANVADNNPATQQPVAGSLVNEGIGSATKREAGKGGPSIEITKSAPHAPVPEQAVRPLLPQSSSSRHKSTIWLRKLEKLRASQGSLKYMTLPPPEEVREDDRKGHPRFAFMKKAPLYIPLDGKKDD